MYRLGDDDEAEEDRIFLQGFDRIEAQGQQRRASDLRRKRLTYVMAAVGTLVGVLLVVSLSVGLARRTAQPWSCPDERGAQYNLTFFVIGDWGRHGNANQRKVAEMMGDVGACMRPAFVVSTGDNFYSSGLSSAGDPAFGESFANVYTQPALQVNWYAVLGNHDYGNDIDPRSNSCAATTLEECPADCCYSSVWQMTGRPNDIRWHCQNGTYSVPTGDPELIDIIMMDTSPFMRHYKKESWYYNAGGIWQQDTAAIKRQVRQRLADSKARWKVVVGHHPIASYGEHCGYGMGADCEDMSWLEGEMQDAGAAAYLCGHDHDLQYITRPAAAADPAAQQQQPAWPVYAVSGGGSDIRSGEFARYRKKEPYNLDFMADDQGFLAVRVNATHAVLHFYAASHTGPAHTATLAAKQ